MCVESIVNTPYFLREGKRFGKKLKREREREKQGKKWEKFIRSSQKKKVSYTKTEISTKYKN